MWDAKQYLRFGDERSRPFVDLLARVGATDPALVVDLGCGPGHLTALLAERWPSARVVGVDDSPAMIEAARANEAASRVEFVLADAATWEPERPVDVVLSNATLQWIPQHDRLLARMASWAAPSGWVAVQVPGNFTSPSHVALAEQCESPRWAAKLADARQRPEPVPDPATYAEVLLDAGLAVDAWETTYFHLLRGEDPVLQWVSGTALRPVLAWLDAADTHEFTRELSLRLRKAYPPGRHGTTFPFRRVFAVGNRSA